MMAALEPVYPLEILRAFTSVVGGNCRASLKGSPCCVYVPRALACCRARPGADWNAPLIWLESPVFDVLSRVTVSVHDQLARTALECLVELWGSFALRPHSEHVLEL